MDSKGVSPPNIRELELLAKKNYTIIGSAISCGSFAAVYKAKRNEQTIAVKIIDCELNSEDYRYKFLPRELYVLKKLRHPFITTIYDIFTIGNRLFVFMELAIGDGIDLLKDGPLAERQCKILFKQISLGLQYMHNLGIAHRDLKCENILLYNNKTVAKLTDFGFSRNCFDTKTGKRILVETHCGSAAYVGPEVLEPGSIDAIKADCWSIGVVLYVFLNNRLPFNDKSISRQLRKQKTRQYYFHVVISKECEDLIRKLLNPDITFRYSMKHVLNHKWIKNVRIDALNINSQIN